jgi:hypothetical protein
LPSGRQHLPAYTINVLKEETPDGVTKVWCRLRYSRRSTYSRCSVPEKESSHGAQGTSAPRGCVAGQRGQAVHAAESFLSFVGIEVAFGSGGV